MPNIPLIAMPTYDGELVFPFMGDWSGSIQHGAVKTLDQIASDSGIASVALLQRSATSSAVIKEIFWSRQALAAAWLFLKATGGRVIRFWMPTLKRDFILNGNQSAGYFLQCLPSEFYGTFDATGLEFPAVMILDFASSRWHARQVIGVTRDGEGNETLQVFGPLPALPEGSIVSLMTLARLSTEDIEIAMENTEVGSAEFHVESLPEEAVAKAITSGGADGDIILEDGLLQPDA